MRKLFLKFLLISTVILIAAPSVCQITPSMREVYEGLFMGVPHQDFMQDKVSINYYAKDKKKFAELALFYDPRKYNPEKGGDDNLQSTWYMISLFDQ